MSVKRAGRLLARKIDFDVVLLDLKLPDGRGQDLLPSLRRQEKQPAVVIVSGSYDADDALPLLGQCDAILPKPVPTKTLTDTIVWAAERDRSERPAHPIDEFAAKLGLTESETCLLRETVMDPSGDIATRLRLAPSSISTLWQRIFDRTGVRCQRDVLAMVLRHAMRW